MCREFLALHLPNPNRVRADFVVLAQLSRGLNGGDILNICLNAIYAGRADANPERWEVSQAMIEAEIKKARKAKAEHLWERRKAKRVFGFGVGLWKGERPSHGHPRRSGRLFDDQRTQE